MLDYRYFSVVMINLKNQPESMENRDDMNGRILCRYLRLKTARIRILNRQ